MVVEYAHPELEQGVELSVATFCNDGVDSVWEKP